MNCSHVSMILERSFWLMGLVVSDDLLLLLDAAAVVLLAEDPGRRNVDASRAVLVGCKWRRSAKKRRSKQETRPEGRERTDGSRMSDDDGFKETGNHAGGKDSVDTSGTKSIGEGRRNEMSW